MRRRLPIIERRNGEQHQLCGSDRRRGGGRLGGGECGECGGGHANGADGRRVGGVEPGEV